MDGQDYLNQISASVRPYKQPKSGLLSSPIAKVIVGGLVALILIIILGSILGGGKSAILKKGTSLKYSIEGTLEVISKYQPNIKSSDLRSDSASLYTVLKNTDRDLTDYLVAKQKFQDGGKKEDVFYTKLRNEAMQGRDVLSNELFEAKINGVLDKVYAYRMAYEISSIMARLGDIYELSKDNELQSLLATSINSLDNLYNKFNDFSETN